MTPLTFFFVVFVVALGAYVFGLSRSWRGVPVFVILVILVYVGGVEVMGTAKPFPLEFRRPEQAALVASDIRENEAIYLWIDKGNGPVGYVIPWDKDTAKALKRARDAGGRIIVKRPFDPSLERRRTMFHPEPQQAGPPKQ